MLWVVTLVLVLLSATRCQATRPSFMEMVGPSGVDADFFNRVGRQLLVSPGKSKGWKAAAHLHLNPDEHPATGVPQTLGGRGRGQDCL